MPDRSAPLWMDAVARSIEQRLLQAGIRLTLGGEPTVVPFDPVGAEWSITADGPHKLQLARRLARELQRRAWPGSTLLFCPGKRYEGEVNPRWALRLISGQAGRPVVRWPEPCQPGLKGCLPQPEQGLQWLQRLGERLGISLQPLPLRDPLDPERRVWAVPLSAEEEEEDEAPAEKPEEELEQEKLEQDDEEEKKEKEEGNQAPAAAEDEDPALRCAAGLEAAEVPSAGELVAHADTPDTGAATADAAATADPAETADSADTADSTDSDDKTDKTDKTPAAIRWLPACWDLQEDLRELSGAAGPAGLRLPLEHLDEEIPRQVLTLEIDTEGWELFLPPLTRRPLELLLQAIADGLTDASAPGEPRAALAAPRLSGVLPVDAAEHWQVLGLTADPGVLEINLPVCHGWADYHGWLQLLEELCAVVGLRSWKPGPAGRQETTGGGNHLLWGGPDLQDHPFFSRPAWLVGILRYWQQHPSLSYLFCGASVGPASQSPRPDETGSLFDLELAYRCLEQADDGRSPQDPRGDHRSLIGETLRHLHADKSGNNHRSEISFDKFWNPAAPGGCQGLVEFRALESLPKAHWSSAVALLWSALAVHLLEPIHRPTSLREWGAALHDRMLLPSQLWADLEAVLADLRSDGLKLEPQIYRQIWEWRFPPLLQWRRGDHALEIRPALEPWPLICDTPVEGGYTTRFVDASLRRMEITISEALRQQGTVLLQGRPLPLAELPHDTPRLAVRYRHQRLYPCLHPAIEPQLPLLLEIRYPHGIETFRYGENDLGFEPSEHPASEQQADRTEQKRPWDRRIRPDDLTLDLRLDD